MAGSVRRSWNARLITLAVASAATVFAGSGAALAAPGGSGQAARNETTVAYGNLSLERMDAYWHTTVGGARQPALLILHGGYWVKGDKNSWHKRARWFADRGFAVFAADYRLAGDVTWPAPRDDALAAVAYIKHNAGNFDVDPGDVMVLGSSAGGQLAAQLATYGSGAKRVRGAVAMSPVDLPYQAYLDGRVKGADDNRRYLSSSTVLLAGCRPGADVPGCWQTWWDMSPQNQAGQGDAPMLITHSADDLVPPSESYGLRDNLQAAGVRVTMRVFVGDRHATAQFHIPGVRKMIFDWLTKIARPRGRSGADRQAANLANPAKRPVPSHAEGGGRHAPVGVRAETPYHAGVIPQRPRYAGPVL